MKRHRTELNDPQVHGASVVELEAMWRPDADTKPFWIKLDFAEPPDRPRGPGLWRASGAWMLAILAVAAGWASGQL